MALEHAVQKFLMQDVEKKDLDCPHNIASLRGRLDFLSLRHKSFSFFNRNLRIISKTLNKKEQKVYIEFKKSKKVGKAVRRNKIRRRIRNIFYEINQIDRDYLTINQAVLFIPNQNSININYTSLSKIIRTGLSFLKKKVKSHGN